MRKVFFLFAFLGLAFAGFTQQGEAAQDSAKVQPFVKGFGIYPMPTVARLGYRSNLHKKWSFDGKLGYTFTLLPQLNLELSAIRRHARMDILNFYSGIGFAADGLSPGLHIPIGFEIMPFKAHRNLVFVAEASPRVMYSFSSAFYSTLAGNVGIIYFRPPKKKKRK